MMFGSNKALGMLTNLSIAAFALTYQRISNSALSFWLGGSLLKAEASTFHCVHFPVAQ